MAGPEAPRDERGIGELVKDLASQTSTLVRGDRADPAEMSDTVDALGQNADVKARAKEPLQDKRDSAKESVVGATTSTRQRSPSRTTLNVIGGWAYRTAFDTSSVTTLRAS
jgi:hypothetical protein